MRHEVIKDPSTVPIDHALQGRQAWTRNDLKESDWRVVQSAAALDEIRTVAAILEEQPVPLLALRPDSFQMPHCQDAMRRVSDIIKNGVKFALAERLPVEELSVDLAKSIYWMLSSMIARPVAQKLDGTMIYDMTDTGAKPLPGSGVRPGRMLREQVAVSRFGHLVRAANSGATTDKERT